jgi:hypothetical protein
VISDLEFEVGIEVVFGSARFTNVVVSELGQKLWYLSSNWYQSHILKVFRRGS